MLASENVLSDKSIKNHHEHAARVGGRAMSEIQNSYRNGFRPGGRKTHRTLSAVHRTMPSAEVNCVIEKELSKKIQVSHEFFSAKTGVELRRTKPPWARKSKGGPQGWSMKTCKK